MPKIQTVAKNKCNVYKIHFCERVNTMQLKLDVKTLIVGIVLGVIITAAIGAGGSADSAAFGIAIESDGSALVKAHDDSLYIVDSKNGMATRVLYANINANPGDRRNAKGNFFSLAGLSQSK